MNKCQGWKKSRTRDADRDIYIYMEREMEREMERDREIEREREKARCAGEERFQVGRQVTERGRERDKEDTRSSMEEREGCVSMCSMKVVGVWTLQLQLALRVIWSTHQKGAQDTSTNEETPQGNLV